MLAAGVVITGGTTLLDGMPELGEQVLGLPVRRASPIGVGGLIDVVRSPAYSTAVGLVKYGAERLRAAAQHVDEDEVVEVTAGDGWGAKVGAWFREVF
jgi:cell division protein FtsA